MVFESVRPISLNASSAAILIARFVIINSSGEAIHASASNLDIDGVSLEAVDVNSDGLAFPAGAQDGCKLEVEAGAAVSVGDLVMSDTVGRAITAATSGNKKNGRALTAATAAGEVITILFRKDGIV